MEQVWQFAGSSTEGEVFEVRGVNIWDHDWQPISGQEAHVHDPVYGREFIFQVFSVQDGDQRVEFAAGEFSDGEWGFYTRE